MSTDQFLRISRRTLLAGSLATLFSPPAIAQCAPIDLGIQNIPQEMSNWCWAAAAQQIIYWVSGNAPPQCALVALAYNNLPQNVCSAPGAANVPGYSQHIQFLIRRFVGAFSNMAGPGSPDQVYSTIVNQRPIIMLVNPDRTKVGHFVVIRGVSCHSGSLIVHINDPMGFPGFSNAVSYQQLASMWQSAIIVG